MCMLAGKQSSAWLKPRGEGADGNQRINPMQQITHAPQHRHLADIDPDARYVRFTGVRLTLPATAQLVPYEDTAYSSQRARVRQRRDYRPDLWASGPMA